MAGRNWLWNTHAVRGDDDQNPKHHDEQHPQDNGQQLDL